MSDESALPAAQEKSGSTVRRVVLLAAPPAMELDIVGPATVFAAVNHMDGRTEPAYEIELATTGSERVIAGSSGLSLIAHHHYREVRGKIDTLLVVGGAGALAVHDPPVLDWIRETAQSVRRLGSVCTGAFLLAEAGLLDGRRATTHWAWTGELALRYPKVTVVPDPIWVRDGNVTTSAGVTTGMDLALRFVEDDFGGAVALEAARNLVLFLRRPGGQAQFSISLSTQASDKNPFLELQVWMAENLAKDLSVEALASRAAMSPRNFARNFVRELGITPARYVERLRIEAARRRLEQTSRSVEEIAPTCGFGSSELMRRAFLRTIGISPSHYRRAKISEG